MMARIDRAQMRVKPMIAVLLAFLSVTGNTCLAQAPVGTPATAPPAAGPAPGAAAAPANTISGTTKTVPAQVGAEIPVTTTLSQPATATLIYRLNYDGEQQVPFSAGPGPLTAVIPAGMTMPGHMVRWAVQATLPSGQQVRDPPFADANATQYHGTVIPNPATSSSLPVIEWWSMDPGSVTTQKGAKCSLYFKQRFYDNIDCSRKGVTTLSWPKPKLKFVFHKDNLCFFNDGLPLVKRIDLNSNFREPGQNSYMRETVGYALMKAAGAPVVNTQWASLNLNNEYYGFFSLLTKIDEDYLRQNGLPPSGGLYKALDGQLSNLRWDVPTQRLQFYYKLEGANKTKDVGVLNGTAPTDPYPVFKNFLLGINGGQPPLTRSNCAFDDLDLPAIVNEMAVQTAMLNQDRCTKNYYIYQNPTNSEWRRLPYDLKSTFATDRGFNGNPTPDYCILACDQWNSPLYCSDTQHAQDLSSTTPWAIITPQFGTFSGSSSGRRLSQAATLTAARPNNATVDVNLTNQPSLRGANGTINYLIKLIVDVPETRAMYFRRLRTIMDTYLNGWVQQQFTNNYNIIAGDAKKDNAKWNGGDPALGYKQLIEETLPIRKQQLYATYGPGGPQPFIPAAQPPSISLALGNSGGTGDQAYLEILNPQNFAVDISGFKLTGAAQFTFVPGTVIPGGGSIFVSPNVNAFRARPTSPKAGENRFVQGPAKGDVTGAVTIANASGQPVPTAPATSTVADSGAAGGR